MAGGGTAVVQRWDGAGEAAGDNRPGDEECWREELEADKARAL